MENRPFWSVPQFAAKPRGPSKVANRGSGAVGFPGEFASRLGGGFVALSRQGTLQTPQKPSRMQQREGFPCVCVCGSLVSGQALRQEKDQARRLIVTALPNDSRMGCACRIRCWMPAWQSALEVSAVAEPPSRRKKAQDLEPSGRQKQNKTPGNRKTTQPLRPSVCPPKIILQEMQKRTRLFAPLGSQGNPAPFFVQKARVGCGIAGARDEAQVLHHLSHNQNPVLQ